MTDVKSLYAAMLRLRIIEEYIAQIYHLQEMKCPTHLCTGQEAVAVGVCANLRLDDVVFTTHRSHGWYISKGGDLKRMMAELFGKAAGCSGGWGGSMHLIDIRAGVMGSSSVVGGSLPHAVGSALAFKMQKTDRVALAGFGDGTVEEGVFHESLNFAALKRLPVILVCENNLYAVQSHIRDRQPHSDIHKRADGYGLPGVLVDGNDVVAVYEAARQAIRRARAGEGPTLLECRTYRWREHVGPNYDYDLGYRTKQELDEWMSRCPIRKLEREGVVDEREAGKMRLRYTREVEEAVEFARQTPFPTMDFNEFPMPRTEELHEA
jgi:pyruvate dehydrogenase E1 component alpha subunit